MSNSPVRGGMLSAIRSRFTAVNPAAMVTLREISWEDPTAGLAGRADRRRLRVAAAARCQAVPVGRRRPRAPAGRHAGRGIVLLARVNAPLVALDGVITRPVRGLPPGQFALAWRAGDRRPLVRDYARACRPAVPAETGPGGLQGRSSV